MTKFYSEEELNNEMLKVLNFCECLFSENVTHKKDVAGSETITINKLGVEIFIYITRNNTFNVSISEHLKFINFENLPFSAIIQMLRTLEIKEL